MSLVIPPTNFGLTFRLGPDGSLIPCDTGAAGSAGLGTGTAVVINMGGDSGLGSGTVIQYLYQNCGFSLPRYAVDWGALKTAVAAGRAYTANTF